MIGGFPTFFGKGLIVSRTLSGIFLVGTFKRARQKEKDRSGESPKNQENPPKTGKVPNCWQFPNLVVSNLVVCNSCSETLFCAHVCSFVRTCICALLQTCMCALLRICTCALLRTFACFCERPRLERPRLGTPDVSEIVAHRLLQKEGIDHHKTMELKIGAMDKETPILVEVLDTSMTI